MSHVGGVSRWSPDFRRPSAGRFGGRPLHVLLFFLPLVCLSAAVHYPSPTGYVTDAANILDASSRQTLEQQLSDFEKQTSIEIAVATVPSLEGETVEDYAVALFKQWGVGKKGKDNGVLLLIAPNERKMRIEVGYGLEGKLNDGLCGQIIRDQITPEFKIGHYGLGIAHGVDTIVQVLRDEPVMLSHKPGLPLWYDGVLPIVGAFFVLPITVFTIILAIFVNRLMTGSLLGFLLIPIGLILDIRRYSRGISGPLGGIGSRSRWGGYTNYGGFGGGFSGGGGFGGFGGGSSGGGGASGGW